MTYFDYLETEFTLSNQSMATGNPNDVTVPRQARVNATLALVGMSRSVMKWGYVLSLLGAFLLMALRFKKFPEFKSSIPNQKPAGKPSLAAVPDAAPTPNANLQD